MEALLRWNHPERGWIATRAVQIHHQQCEEPVGATLSAESGALQLGLKLRAIRQSSEGIMRGFVAQSVFRLLAVGDVTLGADNPRGFAGFRT